MSSIASWLLSPSPQQQQGGASPVFSYVLLGAAVLLLVAVIFGELEAA